MYRRYRPTSIWGEMDRLQREMNRIFEDFYPLRTLRAPSFPAMNVWADEEGVLVTAELPGLDSKDIKLNILEDNLTISGERQPDELPEGARYHRQERGYGKFTRNLQLPYKVDANKVKAVFKDGVLEVSLPRAEEHKPKKIAIKVS